MIKKLKFAEVENTTRLILKEEYTPLNITYYDKKPNEIEFNNGHIYQGICINCDEKPCFQLAESEVKTEILEGIPYNNDRRVCPSNAIELALDGISIQPDQCIGCGLCLQRCPSAGISISDESTFYVVNKAISDPFIEIRGNNVLEQSNTWEKFQLLPRSIQIQEILTETSYFIRKSFLEFSRKIPDIELILIRNLLVNIGIKNKISAQGNNDSRMDVLAQIDNIFIPAESELVGSDILGLPRRILEGISYLHARHGIEKKFIIPLLFTYVFPRKRSDFYEVIYDIEAVTGFRIKTIPFHALYLLNLFQIKLTAKNFQEDFLINKEVQNIDRYINKYIPEIEEIDENFGNSLYTFEK